MRRLLFVVGLIGCGSTAGQTPRKLTAREIVDTSSPAVVEVEAGDDRVGTGFIVDKSGLIATNLHVIEGESTIKVKLYKEQAELSVASIAGYDPAHDLAIMRITAPHPLHVVKLGDSNVMSAGDPIFTIGNPLGELFSYSITGGLISQVRQVTSDVTILQFDAPISLGSSGGPLFNQFGEVVGVTTMIVKESGAQNINLAMPTNYLSPMLKQPRTIALDEFAKATLELAIQHGEAPRTAEGSDGGEDGDVEIRRFVPNHATAVLDGCSVKDVQDYVTSIAQAIESGAPLYNQKTRQGYEACYRVYEGTALRYANANDSACKGVRAAFGDGLLRAKTLETYKEKAWAMRDAFDGLIDVAQRWAQQNHATLPVN